jgi:hypothetical protein
MAEPCICYWYQMKGYGCWSIRYYSCLWAHACYSHPMKFDVMTTIIEPPMVTCESGFSSETLRHAVCGLDDIRLWRYVVYREVFAVSWTVMFQVCWMAVILFSPVQQLTRRLGFAVLGVLTLIGLSEISKLNLHQYLQSPKVSENSVR